MTRTTRRTVCFITALFVIAAVVVFFAWATSGFKNWNAATWFGNGSKQTEQVKDKDKPENSDETDKPVTASTIAANAGLTYDSEFSQSATAVVKQYAPPEVEFLADKIVITCSGDHGGCVKYSYGPFNASDTGNSQLGTTGIPAYTEYSITYDELRSKCGTGGKRLTFVNFGEGDYKSSKSVSKSVYIMPDGYTSSEMTLTGTNVKIPLPNIDLSSSDEFYYDVKIASVDGASNDLFSSNSTESNPLFTVVSNADEKYVDVDLTKLSFVNELHPECVVSVQLKWHSGPYTLVAYYTVPDISFGITQLAAPKNITYSDGTLSWSGVTGAQGYAVFDGDTVLKTTTQTSIYIIDDNISVGTHTLRVRALGNVGMYLANETALSKLTPYNAAANIVQYVALTLSIDGDNITKLVPQGSTVGDYLYDVEVPNKEFGGWFYDSGFSVEAKVSDVLDKDTTIYARLSDVKVTERKPTKSWWDKYKWYVLIPCFVIAAVGIVVAGVFATKKKKAA